MRLIGGMVCEATNERFCWAHGERAQPIGSRPQSWNATLKCELGEHFDSPADTKAKLFDYIEVFYNQKRRHSALGYMSPAEYERTRKMPLAAVA